MKRKYFLPAPSHWPILGSISLFFILIGIINLIHANWYGHYCLLAGVLLLVYTAVGWFGSTIAESLSGLHSQQMDRSYRWAMMWFIVSEIAFFGIFFLALFYARLFSVPTLGGLIGSKETHALLWPQFTATWPLLSNPNPSLFPGPKEIIPAWGIPALNTLILLSSAVAVTWAHWGLRENKRLRVLLGIGLAIVLGLFFLSCQAFEYHEAYSHFNLTLGSGIYGTTFFMLTGFHAVHVMIGLTILFIILLRCFRGDFVPEHHFGFEAAAWYWHFVDVVWLFLFIFVYWL